jgi:hypothetical protein
MGEHVESVGARATGGEALALPRARASGLYVPVRKEKAAVTRGFVLHPSLLRRFFSDTPGSAKGRLKNSHYSCLSL